MFADKKKTIYGEKKSVHLKDFKERDLLEAIENHLTQPLTGLNLAAMRAEHKTALADPELAGGYVKVGLVGADLVWRAKSLKGNKVASVILYKNYQKQYDEVMEKSQQALAMRKEHALGGDDHGRAVALMQKNAPPGSGRVPSRGPVFADKKFILYGKNDSVPLKEFAERALQDAIFDHLTTSLAGLNLAPMRAELKKALADPDMAWGHVQVGVASGDLVWKAESLKRDKFFSVILYKNYMKKYEEVMEQSQQAIEAIKGPQTGKRNRMAQASLDWYDYLLRSISRATAEKALAEGISPDGAWLARAENKKLVVSQRRGSAIEHEIADGYVEDGKGPAAAGLNVSKAIKTTAELNQRVKLFDAVDDLRGTPGYFDKVSLPDAKAKLKTAPDNAWLLHGSVDEAGLVVLTWKRAGKAQASRCDTLKAIESSKRYMAANADKQVKA